MCLGCFIYLSVQNVKTITEKALIVVLIFIKSQVHAQNFFGNMKFIFLLYSVCT